MYQCFCSMALTWSFPISGTPAWAVWQAGEGNDHLRTGEAQVPPEHHAGCPQCSGHTNGLHKFILEAESC